MNKFGKTAIFLIFTILLSALLGAVSFAGGSDDMTEPPDEENGTSLEAETAANVLPFAKESDAKSLILIEANTGKVLYEKDADLALSPASVTKVMTMLLVMEAVDGGSVSLDDKVTVSENASKMGGSQVFLEPGEEMTVGELLKCVVVASANDACVALAEHIAGSEENFVMKMNVRAKELGMEHTNFENTNGLDDTTLNHYTSARDISIMSAELIVKHPKILEFSSIWMDSIRDGAFGLTNTNRLIRFYNGANGLKTGSTSKAGFCISAAAKRNGMQLICVVMGASTRDSRNEVAKKLLDYGFAGYSFVHFDPQDIPDVKVIGGKAESVCVKTESFDYCGAKEDAGRIKAEISVPESLRAPLKSGDTVGSVTYTLDGEIIAEKPIIAVSGCDRTTFGLVFSKLLHKILY